MRRYLTCGTAAIALLASPVAAGGLAEPAMEPAVVAERTSGSSGGILIPLLLLILVAAAIASGSDGGEEVIEVSDRRTKTDRRWVGLTADAIPVWRYRYRGQAAVFEGVMAQDVAQRRPDALIMRTGGLMGVDYGRLGTPLRRVA